MTKKKMKAARQYRKFFGVLFLLLFLPVGVYLVNTRTNFVNRALNEIFGAKAEFTVNLTDSYEVDSYPWANFAQGGEEAGGMLAPVVTRIRNLSPDYIRIDHIYDFYQPAARDASGNLVYDWSKLDAEIKNITDTGAKPFLSLSYMPPALSSGSEVDIPKVWSDWQVLVKSTIEHVSGVNGLGISNVYYEVWNEPDLFGGFKTYGPKNYLTLYEFAARGAQSASDVLPFKFGGPATTSLYKPWFDNLLTYTSRNNLRLDFYSWHHYSASIADFERDMRRAIEWLQDHQQYLNIEFIVSESGFDSEIDPGYDGKFAAIHTLAVSALAFEQQNRIFAFEIKDGPGESQYWGRWGMLTHEKFGIPVAKPRFFAFEFLNRLKGRRYTVYGQGTWVRSFVTGDGNAIRMLLVNYDPYGGHIENVPIHFVNLPSQNFIYRRINFLGNSTQQSVNLSGKDWTTHELMEANSAAIIEIIPL